MKVKNMQSSAGNDVPNQFIITDHGRGALGNFIERRTFQSYQSVIAIVTEWEDETRVELDRDKWDYSRTTSKYRNMFLNETTRQTQQKIDSGEYTLVDLNK